MQGRGPGAVGAANNTRLLQFVKFLLGLLEAGRIQAASFCKNRRASGFNMVENTMLRGVAMQICGENRGIVAKELANGGKKGVKTGEEWSRGGRE